MSKYFIVFFAVTTVLSTIVEASSKENAASRSAYRAAKSMMDKNKIREAIPFLTKTLALDPTDYVALTDRAHAYVDLMQYAQALKDIRRALELNSKDGGVLELRARVEFETGQYKLALQDLTKSLQFSDSKRRTSCLYDTRGKVHLMLNNDQAAYRDFTRSVEADKLGNSSVYCNRGNLLLRLGKYRQAIDDYNMSLKISGPQGNQMIFANRMKAYEKLGMKDLASKDRKFLRQESEDINGELFTPD